MRIVAFLKARQRYRNGGGLIFWRRLRAVEIGRHALRRGRIRLEFLPPYALER